MKGALKYFIAILVVLFSLWIIGTSSSFKTCNAVQSAASTEQHKKNPPQFILSLTDNVVICIRCAGHVLYEYRDAVTAVATAFIAAFTYTLFAATRGLVEAAKIQSDDMKRSIVASEISATAATTQAEVARKSLADIERPYLFIFNVSRLTVQDFYDHDEDEVGYTLKATYDVANHGKYPQSSKACAPISVYSPSRLIPSPPTSITPSWLPLFWRLARSGPRLKQTSDGVNSVQTNMGIRFRHSGQTRCFCESSSPIAALLAGVTKPVLA